MAYRKLGRTSSQRKAMLRDLTTDLLINESNREQLKLVLRNRRNCYSGKRGDLCTSSAAAFVRNEIASENYDEATDKYTSLQHFKIVLRMHLVTQNVNAGYIRILKLNHVVVMQRQWRSSN